jgi:sodium transport system permease protein
MHPILTVLRKEMLDGSRDKRAVMSALLFPILGPALVYFMLTQMINMRADAEDTIVPIAGQEHAPALMQWLREQNVRYKAFDGDARQAIKEKQEELVLIIPENFQERFRTARPAVIEMVIDGSRTDSQATIGRMREIIRRYSGTIASLRLMSRGIAPEIMRTVSIQEIDVASQQQRAAAALNFIPMYIILAAFVSGMGIAIDSTAGERERKSLEPLLINPVERFHIVTGKWLAASMFAALGMVLTAILCIAAMTRVPLEQVGLNFNVTIPQVVIIILATAPLALLATGMQVLFAMFAKSFKDAQSYMGLLVIFPMVPSFLLMFNPVSTKAWMYAVPMLGQHLLLVDLLGNKEIPAIAYFYSAGSCLIFGLGLVVATAHLFKRESIITS